MISQLPFLVKYNSDTAFISWNTDSETAAVLIFDKIKELMDAEAAILQPQAFSVEELLAMPPLQPDRLAEISS